MFKIIVLSSVLVLIASFVLSPVLAMGDAPSTCENRYDGDITSMTITSGGQTYDPISNPGLTIQMDNDQTYSVKFTIHTPIQSSQGNSLQGTTWYHSSAFGYWSGRCVDGAGPDMDISIVSEFEHPANLAPETTQTVSWATLTSGEITYNIEWVNSANVQAVSDPPENLSAKAVSASRINLSWSVPANDGGSQITSYVMERSNDRGTTWSEIANTDSTNYSDTGLARNTSYLYRVSAVNSVGTSEPSNSASAKTFLLGHLIGTINLGKLGTSPSTLQISLGH